MNSYRLAIPLFLLVSCIDVPKPILFASDERILRGTWQSFVGVFGAQEDIRLELTATYLDSAQYSLSGTIQLAANPVVAIVGVVEGKDTHSYIAPQIPAPRASIAVLKYTLTSTERILSCEAPRVLQANSKPIISCQNNVGEAASSRKFSSLQKQ